ncbi:MAG: SH3 domain-containing protein [Mesorhizobium sp.]
MKKDYWAGSQGALRSTAAYSGRDIGRLERIASSRGGYAALATGFATVVVLSVGATIFAMSLLAGGESQTEAPEQAVRASIVTTANAAQPSPGAAQADTDTAASGPQAEVVAVASATPHGNLLPLHEGQAANGASAEGVDELASNDPRWAQGETPAQPIDDVRVQPAGQAQAMVEPRALQDNGAARALKQASIDHAGDEADTKDPQATAAIAARTPAKEKADPPKASSAATLNTDSNLRSGPDKKARIIGTVPARKPVQIIACKSWCEIVYDGKRGFVYSGFVRKGEARDNRAAADIGAAKPRAVPQKAERQAASGLPGVSTSDLPKVLPADGSKGASNRGG